MIEGSVSSYQQENLSTTKTKFDESNISTIELLPSFVSTTTTNLETEISNNITTNRTNAVVEPTISKEMKNVIVKRDIVREKEPLNIVFGGHVDAGKSTTCRQLMYLTGQMNRETFEKYENEGRQYGYFAPTLNSRFETERKRCTILHTLGYRYCGSDQINRTALADIAILVISARKGEFETGFERGGQTREHAMLVKTAGVRYLVVLINKMDDPTVNWDQARYDEIRDKLTPYLKKCGFKPGEDTIFMPCSGMSGAFLKEPPSDQVVSWYKGPSFIEYLDSLPSFNRSIDGPLRMPIVERYKEMGVIIMGKIESGCCRVGDKCLVMPNRTRVEVTNIYYEEIETDSCVCGENVRLKLKNIEEEEISLGFVLCDTQQEPCSVGRVFDAQIDIVEHKSIICSGYITSLHMHGSIVEVELKRLIVLIDRNTGGKIQEHSRYIKQDQVAIARFEITQAEQMICLELFKRFPRLGQFTLRDEGRTIAVGKVLKIIE